MLPPPPPLFGSERIVFYGFISFAEEYCVVCSPPFVVWVLVLGSMGGRGVFLVLDRPVSLGYRAPETGSCWGDDCSIRVRAATWTAVKCRLRFWSLFSSVKVVVRVQTASLPVARSRRPSQFFDCLNVLFFVHDQSPLLLFACSASGATLNRRQAGGIVFYCLG